LTYNCELCDKKVSYHFGNVDGETVLHNFFQVKQNYICSDCCKDVVNQTHHTVTKGRKHITKTLELDRPDYPVGKVFNRKCEES
jgi:hypothetical protein